MKNSKHIRVIAVILTVVLCLFALEVPVMGASKTTVYSNSSIPLKFTLASGWEKQKNQTSSDPRTTVLFSFANMKISGMITVITRKVTDPKIDLKTYVENMVQDELAEMKGSGAVDPKTSAVKIIKSKQGLQFGVNEISMQSGGLNRIKQYTTTRNGKVYVVLYIISKDNYNKGLTDLSVLIDTFSFSKLKK